jgi:hypothetical protein
MTVFEVHALPSGARHLYATAGAACTAARALLRMQGVHDSEIVQVDDTGLPVVTQFHVKINGQIKDSFQATVRERHVWESA